MRLLGQILNLVGFTGLAVSGVVSAVAEINTVWAAIDSVALVCIGLILSKEERPA